MKTIRKQAAFYNMPIFKLLKSLKFIFAVVLFLCLFGINEENARSQKIEIRIQVVPPLWAPHYENIDLVHYYYLPDIECYYDVWHHEFIYLEDGEWMFSTVLPPYYSWYDLDNAFVVVLDNRVQKPWMHFPYYVAHYPRYYYRTIYKECYNDRRYPIRGFNENARIVVFNKADVHHHKKEREREVQRNHPENRVKHTRPSESMRYEGKEIGKPVEVHQNMTKPREEKKQDKKQEKQVKQNSGRRR
jgi:hypothetical protein